MDHRTQNFSALHMTGNQSLKKIAEDNRTVGL